MSDWQVRGAAVVATAAPARVRARRVDIIATHSEPPKSQFPLPFVRAPQSEIAASFRLLRHRLAAAGDPRIIAITSPDREEGKSTCAVNLAMAMAEHESTEVLLVEANLRAPRLCEMLGFAPPECFATQMGESLGQDHTVWKGVAAFFPNLHVLALDPRSPRDERLNAAAFAGAMRSLADSDYQHIVVDCPSVVGTADVNVIADSADGILLTCRGGTTTRDALQLAVRHLSPTPVLGCVLLES